MKKQRKFAIIIGIVYCFSMVANAQHQWVFKGETPNGMLYSLSSVNLANMKVKKSLFYQGREKGKKSVT